ncbi:MAG: hypothetical protein ACREQ2_12220 [Candidatus Binatia bacterium]
MSARHLKPFLLMVFLTTGCNDRYNKARFAVNVSAKLLVFSFAENLQGRISGLAVPDMPVGSPGMEGGKPERYDVLPLTKMAKLQCPPTGKGIE